MLRAILIDDEEHCQVTLRILLQEYCPQVEIVAVNGSGKDGLASIRTLNPDIVFLDIEMPGMNGFEMLEQLAQIPCSIIFTTGYDQYAIKAFRFSALDYLLKPIDHDELQAAVRKVEERKQNPMMEQFQIMLDQVKGKKTDFKKVAVPTLDGYELIPSDDIVRCEADNNYTHLFLKNKGKIIASRTLKEMEQQLQPLTNFMRVHNSYMVNLNEVTKYVRGEGGYLIMSDGSTVNVSKSRKEALIKVF